MKNHKILMIFITLILVTVGCSNKTITTTSSKTLINNNGTDYKKMYEKLLQDQAPQIKDIKFETIDGKVIELTDGWYVLGSKVKIIITLEGASQEIDLFTTPTGSGVYKEQKLIEIITPEKNVVEYTWDVPQNTMGYFQVIAYNKNVGKRSELINIISKKD